MFETIKRLYSKSGDSVIVSNAVKKGWITAEQYEDCLLYTSTERPPRRPLA